MNEDLYNKIERYNNGEMEADEAATFRQQMYDDRELADEVRLHQRIDEEFSDAKKIALRGKLGELSENYKAAAPVRVSLRHWMPVILSTAAAAVALYFFVNRSSVESLFSGTGLSEVPVSYEGNKALEENQRSLGVRLAQADENAELEAILGKSASEITINIQQPKDSFVLAPTANDKAFPIKGDISQTDLERYGKLIIRIYDAEKLLDQKQLVIQEPEPLVGLSQSFLYNLELPPEQGWYYYQIVSQDEQIILYTGKFGVRR